MRRICISSKDCTGEGFDCAGWLGVVAGVVAAFGVMSTVVARVKTALIALMGAFP